MERIDELKSPAIVGRKYLVPVAVYKSDFLKHLPKSTEEDENWLDYDAFVDLRRNFKKVNDYFEIPILRNLHSDKESGQEERHYHIDERFLMYYNDTTYIIRIDEADIIEIKYVPLECYKSQFDYNTSTSPSLVAEKYKKRKCKNFICPHKGFDLSQVKPDEQGYFRCPLHGLKFHKTEIVKTKKTCQEKE